MAAAFGVWPKSPDNLLTNNNPITPQTPVQLAMAIPKQWSIDRYTLTALASFDIEARVLSEHRYRSDREAELSPIDLALGWGPMSDPNVLNQLDISQRDRWYFWRAQSLPVPRQDIEHNSANMHMIPASPTVAAQLQKIQPGSVVHLIGYLVEAKAEDGWHWRSSLTRTDTGNGACELVYVEKVIVS